MVKVRRGYRSKNVRVEGATGGRTGGLRLPASRGGKAGAGAGGAGLLGIIVVVVISLLSGGGGSGDGGLGDVLGGLQGGQENNGTTAPPPAITEDQLSEWSGIFDDIQFMWMDIFDSAGIEYRTSELVIFSGSTRTDGCGDVPATAGPIKVPAGDTVRIAPDLVAERSAPLGAQGDVAIA
ncbi:MAG: neutral zinc metallopeptidase, partial [Actinomycetota bacterium]